MTPAPLHAEGTAQLGFGTLQSETRLLVDVIDGDAFLNISARNAENSDPLQVTVTGPAGTTTSFTLSAGNGLLSDAELPAVIAEPLRISATPGVHTIQFSHDVDPFDITVSANDTEPVSPDAAPPGGGRLHSTDWRILGGFDVDSSVSSDFYVRTPVTASTEYVWKLELMGLGGGEMCFVGNSQGLPGILSRSSQTRSAVEEIVGQPVNELDLCNDLQEFPLYVSVPNSLNPRPGPTTVSFERLAGCRALVEGVGGQIEFLTEAPSNYQIVIDTDRDQVFGPDDALMTGSASPGSNVVTWDGLDGSGAVVPASSDPYDVRIFVGLGEFHFTAVDVETANAGIAIRQLDPLTAVDTSTLMYWDDTAVLSNGIDTPPDPAVTLPDGLLSDVNAHAWGDFTSDGSDGIGNDAYFDTWVFGQEVFTTVQVTVEEAALDADDDGLDNARECSVGSLLAVADSDGDGLLDSEELTGSGVAVDTDEDQIPDVLDADDDGDGIPTLNEGADPNGDGSADDAQDTDGDGVSDFLDDDDDGDGIPTAPEDPDGNGDPTDDDTDEDGIANYLDNDDDDDSVPTVLEDLDQDGNYSNDDTDQDQIANFLDDDDDGDGIPTSVEVTDAMDLGSDASDTDSDGAPNWLDTDSDDDGALDSVEGRGDANDNGIPDYLDPAIVVGAEPGDAGAMEAGVGEPNEPAEAGVPDAGVPDAGGPNPGVPDAGVPEAGVPDAATIDAGLPGDDDATDDTAMDVDAGTMDDDDRDDDDRDDDDRDDDDDDDRDDASDDDDDEPQPVVPGVAVELGGGGAGGGCSVGHADTSAPWWLIALGSTLLITRRRRRNSRRTHADGSRRRHWLVAAIVGLTGLFAFLPDEASAQETSDGIVIDNFNPAERGSDWFWNESLDLRGHNRWALGITGDWAVKPLVAYDGNGDEVEAIVGQQVFAHAGASLVLWERLRFGINLPILVFQVGDPATVNGVTYDADPGGGIGDLRVGADLRLVGEYQGPATLAIGTQVFFPTGRRDAYVTDGHVRFAPRIMLAGEVGPFIYATRVGTLLSTETNNFAGRAYGGDLQFGAAAGFRFFDDRLVIGPEVFGKTAISDSGDDFFSEPTTPVEGLAGVHYLTEDDWRFGLGFGPGFNRGIGSPLFRAVGSVEWAPQPEEETPPPADRDLDSIPDVDDACPDVPGVVTNDPRTNGCPPDSDGDGIYDSDDACPAQHGEPNADPTKHGCPPDADGDGIYDDVDACGQVVGVPNPDPAQHGCPPDADGDGIYDNNDACPNEPGVADPDPAKNGCPAAKDRDGDGILDEFDACPDIPGPGAKDPAKNGCPRAQITGQQVVIRDRIEFEFDKAKIRPESDPILQAVLDVLRAHPEIGLLEVEGHTDNVGSAKYNLDLSRRRAQAVVDWLVQNGAPKERLASRGMGFERPIDTNETDAGRQNNRRVEFHIVQRKDDNNEDD